MRQGARGAAVIGVVLAALLGAGNAAAYDAAAYEKELARRIEAIDPEAAKLFAEANAARERNDFAGAAALYQKVRERAPKFSAATRRLCNLELHRGARDQAVELCREALANEDIAENQSALAGALVATPKDANPNATEVNEALGLATAAVSRSPDDPYTHMALCEVALRANRPDKLKDCAYSLQRVAPELAPTHAYTSLLAATEGRFGDAIAAIDRAEALGLDHETCTRLRGKYESATPLHERYGMKLLHGLAVWLVGLAGLLGAGALLSALTLSAATKNSSAQDGHAKGADRWLRRIYRVVLWACCAYYYLSLPIVTLIVLVTGGGIIYGFLAIGTIPIKLVAIVGIVTLVSVWAVVKSIFFRPKASEPGDKLDLSEHPKLHGVLGEVAGRVGTRRVDNVYLTPGTELAVFERGGVLAQLTGRTERCLVLGAGVLDGFEVGAFKAVLAHEYGHFHNEDTAGGGFALAVRRSMLMMAISLAQGGAAAWYNPAWLFVSGFYKIFLRISQGASRLQEILADRWAAFAYGADAFANGLRHVIARSIRFDAHAQAALSEVVDQQRALANLYRYRVRGKAPDEGELEKAIEEALNAEPSPYDSHPSPADRLAWVDALPKRDIEVSPDDSLEVWELFSDRVALERRMTQKLRERIQRDHGVVIPAGKPKKKRETPVEDESDDEPAAGGAA